MWWCQFIDWLKFEIHPSSLLNFGMAYMATSLLLPLDYYGHFVITATSLLQPLCYYSHFILAQTKAQSVILLFQESLSYSHTVNNTA